MTVLGAGGGCHWCTEAVVQALRGVSRVEQGFISSDAPYDTPSEAVRVTFDEQVLPLEVLMEVHLRTHAAQSDHSMRGKYRSAFSAGKPSLAARCEKALDRLRPRFDAPLVTKVLALRRFEPSEARFRNYQQTRPEAPFCRTYIDPKLAFLRQRYGRWVA